MSSTLPMAAMFTRNKFIGWYVFASGAETMRRRSTGAIESEGDERLLCEGHMDVAAA
jgi:hypothetical protein